jgi:RNA polymerase sigma-70 factor (ECF subfamily)
MGVVLFVLGLGQTAKDLTRADLALQLPDVFRAHADFVWRGLRRLGVPEADADDALQEVFMVVARRLPEYREQGTLRAWLFCIARQVAMHVHRSEMRRSHRELAGTQVVSPSVYDPQRALEQKQAADLVQRALNELEESQAMALYLADIEELSVPEIAAALNLPLTTVYGRLRLARTRFEQLLKQFQRRGEVP